MPIFRINGENILFVHIAKTGGTSIEQWMSSYAPLNFYAKFKKHGLDLVPQHFHVELVRYFFEPNFFDYSFAVVRNPYWRLLSEYNYRMTRRRLRERILPIPSFERWVTRTLKRYSRNPSIYSNHIRPQVEFLFDDTEVFKLEMGLDAVRQRVAERCGIDEPAPVPRSNKSVVRETKITKAAADMIYDFYRADFERLEYVRDSYIRDQPTN